jgi:hypothetical protein
VAKALQKDRPLNRRFHAFKAPSAARVTDRL